MSSFEEPEEFSPFVKSGGVFGLPDMDEWGTGKKIFAVTSVVLVVVGIIILIIWMAGGFESDPKDVSFPDPTPPQGGLIDYVTGGFSLKTFIRIKPLAGSTPLPTNADRLISLSFDPDRRFRYHMGPFVEIPGSPTGFHSVDGDIPPELYPPGNHVTPGASWSYVS